MKTDELEKMLNQFDDWGAEKPENSSKIVGGSTGLAVAVGVAMAPTVGLVACFAYTCWSLASKAEEASLNRFESARLRGSGVVGSKVHE